jgi:hypothetical protein
VEGQMQGIAPVPCFFFFLEETNMQDNIRIEKERKYWDKIAPEYEHSVIEKYWKVYP